jgi:acyl-CoA thioesterase II
MTMADINALIDPFPSGQHGKWHMTAHRNLCLGPPEGKHLSGGAALASAVAALEAETGRPLIQASAQFLSSPAAGDRFDIEIRTMKAGRSIIQAQIAIVVAGNDAANITAALGARDEIGLFAWEIAPSVPSPEACPPFPFVRKDDGDLHSHLDMRLALDPRSSPTGRACFWIKTDAAAVIPATLLALIADYLPEAIHMNIGQRAGAVSLDNVIRIVRYMATPWLLCDIQLSAISSGLFHGRIAIFAEDGTLLATGGQSGVVRLLKY